MEWKSLLDVHTVLCMIPAIAFLIYGAEAQDQTWRFLWRLLGMYPSPIWMWEVAEE
jgi:hypothetical protein